MKVISYRNHKVEIAIIPTGWKPYRAWFLDLAEKPARGWTEHDLMEFVKWTIDYAEELKEIAR